MGLGKFIKRLRYPHKRTAINYFLDDPRLIFGIPSTPTKLHVACFIERAFGANIVEALHLFFPQDFQDNLQQHGGGDQQGHRRMLYPLVRKYRPEIVVETGVARGFSRAYILLAMQQNGCGHPYSIVLPAQQVVVEEEPTRASHRYTLSDGQKHNQYEAGYMVPDHVRDRWTLTLDDARKALPDLLNKLSTIDFFYHDSLHTYDHKKFEFDTARPHLKERGCCSRTTS